MNNIFEIIKKPCLTEKGMGLQEKYNQVLFKVDARANKIEIKNAVEKLFKVNVTKVRTANMQGKQKRIGRFNGRRPDWKKAIISLSNESKIDFLEGL